MNKKVKNNFKYVVLFVILFIPFIYSFFYLKAYWDPYGKGNIDNLPVAVVNEDEGDRGKSLVDGIKDSKKLKLSVVSSDKAEDGLYDGKYYAIIKVPKDFTSNLESASTNNKKHATITYSPNQKSNYLASQIINTVVLNVEKNLDNEVNSKIVKGLSNNLKEVPNKLDTINSGFNKLSNGTNKLKDGSQKILDGSNTLASNYTKFDDGVKSLKNGANTLSNGTNKIEKELSNSIKNLSEELTDSEKQEILSAISSNPNLSDKALEYAAIKGLESNQNYLYLKNQYETGISSYNEGITTYNAGISQLEKNGIPKSVVEACVNNENSSSYCQIDGVKTLVQAKKTLDSSKIQLDTVKSIIDGLEQTAKETAKKTASVVANTVAINVASSVKQKAVLTTKTSLNDLLTYIKQINTGALTINNGANTLSLSSNQILNGVNTLNSANNELNNGILTLNSSVKLSKDELLSKTNKTKEDLKKVETLEEYSKEPVKVNTKEVNKVSSYGTAFTPLFVSVGLWVGCLMMFMVLYYDKEERFGIFGINDNRLTKKLLAYHGLISVSSILLGLCLDIFLDLNITNHGLYYLSFILIANLFMSLILFLITNFKDVGKFIALILLVLQLGASAGTFPIETVTKGFRWMNTFLPMTYSIRLLKESLVKIEGSLLSKSLIVIIILFVIFFAINIIKARIDEKKAN